MHEKDPGVLQSSLILITGLLGSLHFLLDEVFLASNR